MTKDKMDAERGGYGAARGRGDVLANFGWKNHHLEDLGTDGRTLVKYSVCLRNHLSSSNGLTLFSDIVSLAIHKAVVTVWVWMMKQTVELCKAVPQNLSQEGHWKMVG